MNERNTEFSDLPKDVEAEQAFLGSVLKKNSSMNEVLDFLKPESFYLEAHQAIFRAMIDLTAENSPIDELILGDRLKEMKMLNECGGYAYLADLNDYALVSANSVHYARIVNERYLTREVIRISGELTRKGRDPSADLDELIAEAESRIGEISIRSKTDKFTHLYDVSQNLFAELEQKSKIGDAITGLNTGFPDLDRMTSGLQKSDLIIMAARPSMGKTSLALNMAAHSALKHKKPCLIFSMEMSKEQIAMRILSSQAKVDSESMRNGKLTPDEWTQVGNQLERFRESPIFINDTAAIRSMELSAIAKQLHGQLTDGLSLIVVDYLQLMRSSGKMQNREQEISDISRGLKSLAKELNIPVIALAQLNRALETRSDKRPILSDLRESGSIEQDADIIMFIYRDEVYDPDTEDKGVAELLVKKHRNGSTGVHKLRFIGKYTSFYNLTFEEEPPEFVE